MLTNSFYLSIKNEIKNTLSLGIPLIASQLIYASSGFIGTAMVAHLGKEALAASVLISMVWFSLSVLFFGLLNSVSVLVAHQYGARNDKAISEIMGQGYLFGGLIAILMIVVLQSAPLFLHWSGQPAAVLKLSLQYLHALLWTIPSLVILILSEQFLAAVGRAKTVLRISMIIVPIEIPLIYILIFGKFGLPACGVAGVGYGFAITYFVTATGLVLYLWKAKHYARYQIFSRLNEFNLKIQKELLRIGLPMGLMHLIEVSAFAVATFMISQFGTSMLAAHQITMQYLGYAITVVFAMSQAVSVRVGHAVGQQDLSAIRYATYVGMIFTFLCVAVIALAFKFFPTFFLSIDLNPKNTNNADLIRYASLLLSIGGLLLIFDNFRIIGFGALRGLKDTKFPMYVSFICFWLIGLSSAYVFSFVWHLKGKGIWLGLTLGIACGALIIFIRLQYLLKRVDLKKLLK